MRSNNHCVYDIKYHLVLVTKYRHKCLTSSILNYLESICIDLCNKWCIVVHEFSGEQDHVHFLLEFNPSIQPSKFINNLKSVTSRALRKKYSQHFRRYYWKPVFWSRSYCLLTAGGAPLEILKQYIKNQTRPT